MFSRLNFPLDFWPKLCYLKFNKKSAQEVAVPSSTQTNIKTMSRKRTENPRLRIGVYLDEMLVKRFDAHYEDRYGEFTRVLNELLKHHLDFLDETKLRFRKESSQWNNRKSPNA